MTHDFLWWLHDENRAIRIGDWKLVADQKKPWELYNLKQDATETSNLSVGHPEKVKELEQAWNLHFQEIRTLATQDLPAEKSK